MCVQLQRQVTFKYSYPIVKTIPENSSQEWNAALSFIVTIVAALFSSLLLLPLPSALVHHVLVLALALAESPTFYQSYLYLPLKWKDLFCPACNCNCFKKELTCACDCEAGSTLHSRLRQGNEQQQHAFASYRGERREKHKCELTQMWTDTSVNRFRFRNTSMNHFIRGWPLDPAIILSTITR